MSSTVRYVISKKVAKSMGNIDTVISNKIVSHLTLKKTNGNYSFLLPLKSANYNIDNDAQNIMKDNSQDIFNDITVENGSISFNMSRDKYIKEILENNYLKVKPPIAADDSRNVIVEFSSPNIAKPFHLGHLRSTIIGNYIANINSYLQHKTKRINYLGDWGTQFGFIQLGIKIADITEGEMKSNPIKALYNAYITAYEKAQHDTSINDQAREIFRRLETGDNSIHHDWEIFKNYTIEELKRIYERLGIVFDEYHWESMYNINHIKHIITLMEEGKLLINDEENRRVISLDTERTVPIIKSDGSSLYITRDIAAAIDRYEKNKFDCMYYVTDIAQSEHFSNLVHVLNKMNIPWAERLKHVKYGRVRGMSTRKGTGIFLEDILNKAKEIAREKQMQSITTKVSLDETDDTNDTLGISAVIINDLKRRRQKDFVFDWNMIFDMKGDSGIKLQYTHCRLVNLECNSGAILVPECDPSLLKESEVDDLITLIGKFDEVVLKSYEDLEACVLSVYLFHLSNAISKALKKLRIKDQPRDLGSQRLLLFHAAKNVLAQGMKLLGLKPLDKM